MGRRIRAHKYLGLIENVDGLDDGSCKSVNSLKIALFDDIKVDIIHTYLDERYKRWRSSPVEWCNRFVSFGVGYALSWSGGSSCWVGCGVSRDLVRMSRLR